MKRHLMRLFSLLLALVLAIPVTASAATTSNADRLNSLGLFLGTGAGYDLEGNVTRLHGVVMLIRLLGEDAEAKACKDPCPFEDVSGWGVPYVAYAYKKGYANGVSAIAFDPDTKINFTSYVTLLLRALGYDDKHGDFVWNRSFDKAVEIGMMDIASTNTLTELNPQFLRGDLVDLSLSALTMNMKGSSATLAETLSRRGVFTYRQGVEQGVIGKDKICYKMVDKSTVTRTTGTYTVPSGKVTAGVITVNTKNPKVGVKACLVNNTIGATDTFYNIVTQSGADVVINSNFFQAYYAYKVPIGVVMSDGQFFYGGETLPQFGFTKEGDIQTGMPSIVFTATSGNLSWTCFQCNMSNNDYTYGILYNSAYGPSVTVTATDGVAATVCDGVFTEVRTVYTDDVIPIPENGYLLFFGKSFTKQDYYRTPKVGASVTIAPTFFRNQDDGFSLDGVEQIVSGGPCLVKNGQIYTDMPASFQEERFTTATAPRTAIGKLANGKLLVVSTSAATIQQMRELMLQLGCVEAINLDGGGSTALAYEGEIIRAPGRQLTTTLQIFVSD